MTNDQAAAILYRMNGHAWYGRDLGDWDDPTSSIGRNEYERERWRTQAVALRYGRPLPSRAPATPDPSPAALDRTRTRSERA